MTMTASAQARSRPWPGLGRTPVLWSAYLLAAVLVVGYVNSFELWRRLTGTLGPLADLVPFGVVGALGFLVLWLGYSRRSVIRWPWLGWALAAALVGLALTDPEFPGKRIHVAQYAVLTGVVMMALRQDLEGLALAWTTAYVTFLFGMHDEMIQGLHLARTYGLRDMMVDGCGALAGAFCWHGLALTGSPPRKANPSRVPGGHLAVLAGALLLAIALPAFRRVEIPVWTMVPLAGGLTLWRLPRAVDDDGPLARALEAPTWILAALILYPGLTHVVALEFN